MKPTFVREEIRITPAIVERVRYMQEVLICPACKKNHDGSFKKGEVPSALILHSPASASAVAFVMFSKCFMGLPYYRQESAFTQLGAKIPRETLANWCIITAENYLFPIYELIHRELIRREVIHADETTCQVLREEGKDAQSTSYMWIYTSSTDEMFFIYGYDDVSLIGSIFLSSSGKIAVNEKNYSMENAEQFIEQIIEIMEQVN